MEISSVVLQVAMGCVVPPLSHGNIIVHLPSSTCFTGELRCTPAVLQSEKQMASIDQALYKLPANNNDKKFSKYALTPIFQVYFIIKSSHLCKLKVVILIFQTKNWGFEGFSVLPQITWVEDDRSRIQSHASLSPKPKYFYLSPKSL